MLDVKAQYVTFFCLASFFIFTNTPLPCAFEPGPPPLSRVGHRIKFAREKSLDSELFLGIFVSKIRFTVFIPRGCGKDSSRDGEVPRRSCRAPSG